MVVEGGYRSTALLLLAVLLLLVLLAGGRQLSVVVLGRAGVLVRFGSRW